MNLNHYDLFTAFNLIEAAHLAAGVEPQLCLHENQFSKSDELFEKSAEVKALVDAMNNGLNGAFCNVPNALLDPQSQRKIPGWALIPTSMSHFLSSEPPCITSSKKSINWARKLCADREKGKLIFDRSELQRWFGAKGNGFKTKYEFVQCQNSTPIEKNLKSERWPWGNHHTELLGHLEAAARRYWGPNYIPADATTATINATVSGWLQTERKVSKTMADSIASMLRPDGLPTGPRK